MVFIMKSLQSQTVDDETVMKVGQRLEEILPLVPRRSLRELFKLLEKNPEFLPGFLRAFEICRPCFALKIRDDSKKGEESILCSTYVLKRMFKMVLKEGNAGDLKSFSTLLRQLSRSTVKTVGELTA
jgi:hypothetical protein